MSKQSHCDQVEEEQLFSAFKMSPFPTAFIIISFWVCDIINKKKKLVGLTESI